GSENPGVFLRGATEETALAALMIKQKGSVSSFAVGFAEDDTALAVPREIAKRLGTNHHEVICDMSDMEKLPEIVWALDEPVAGPEALVSHVLARSLRSETDTVLSGAGADDLLSGSLPHRVFMEAHKIPRPLHWFYRMILKMTPLDKLDQHFDTGGKIGMQCRDRLLAFMDEMRGGTPLRRYTSLISVFLARDKAGLYRETMEPVMENFLDMQRDWGQWPTMLSSMLALQKDFAIQDNTLMKLDKMSMLASVEARAPFMDHKLVEFLLGVPDHLKYNSKQNKVILRRHLDKNFPDMPEAPAKTSVLPMAKFMNAPPLKDMIETCLSEASVKRRALFKWEAVQQLLARAKTEDVLYLHQVFSLLMLELWFRVYVDHEKGWISNH
ncbi:MAG TPA: asparagine synthase C-terminal domain-containing protein, partial [Alphaproteobacteria bacterium]|nr:asparagine synthase C-terminal domain-containing protein [Alphaproteobacteria bacterium]